MDTIKILNYQGNKSSLMPFISKHLKKYISNDDKICDIFSGSGTVGAFLKNNYDIVANDAELYSYIISSALLNTPTCIELKNLKNIFTQKYNLNLKNLLKLQEEYVAEERFFLEKKDNLSLVDLYSKIPTIWNIFF